MVLAHPILVKSSGARKKATKPAAVKRMLFEQVPEHGSLIRHDAERLAEAEQRQDEQAHERPKRMILSRTVELRGSKVYLAHSSGRARTMPVRNPP